MLENYIQLENGVVKQNSFFKQKKTYDVEYVDVRYNSYGEKSVYMSYLRLGYLIGTIKKIPTSILDVGYGNGDFLKVCSQVIPKCYGNDVSTYPLPDGVEYVSDITSTYFDVISFFDVLEHFEDISFVQNLKCEHVLISIPWCHNLNDEWFKSWKHRRPDEHLWHFDLAALTAFFKESGFSLVTSSSLEDTIRTPVDSLPNILTCMFRRQDIALV